MSPRGGKGSKVTFHRLDGTRGKQTLTAFYRRPTNSPGGSETRFGEPADSMVDAFNPTPRQSTNSLVEVEAHDGQTLSPCALKKARALVGLPLGLSPGFACALRIMYGPVKKYRGRLFVGIMGFVHTVGGLRLPWITCLDMRGAD